MNRRDLLKWIPPVVAVVTLPAHAQTSVIPVEPRSDDPPPQDEPCTFGKIDLNETILSGDGDCPIRYRIDIGPPTRPARYYVHLEGYVELVDGKFDFATLLPDTVEIQGREYSVYIYCINVFKENGDAIRYCYGQGKA